MNVAFYVAAAIAVASTAIVITRLNAVHALLYLIVSLLSVALVFFTLGAPFVAALEVIIYAGAIMVLFVFVIMMLNLGPQTIEQERQWFSPKAWSGPTILVAILLAELVYVLAQVGGQPTGAGSVVGPKEVGIALFGPYLLGVELASMVLLAGLVGAYHLGRRDRPEEQEKGGG
jgi:NADH-quinone oxidoreductase subunit J